MTPEAQQIAIAEECGLSTKREQLGGVFVYRDKEGHIQASLPDYLHDLNAMHSAWLTLGAKQRAKLAISFCKRYPRPTR